ncbi:MAG: hypothetical protein A2Z46_03270 [Nitrospirae bacterium RBG_19FT_COMBO_55_12]|nr:MAG: hypothetical protein A2Z46_03270 [Nitrospirae bacterium RBG_19FT_COMBO_55_12]
MKKSKSSVSKASTYAEIGEFWDTHELSTFWDKTKPADFDVAMESEVTYYAMDKKLSEEVQEIAHRRGVSADTLVNMWVQEKLREQKA